MEKKNFVHLHVHTEYSLLDGAARIGNLFEKCKASGQKAVAITDHGNMYGVLDFAKQAVAATDPSAYFYDFMEQKREFAVKPIIGCEVYVDRDINVKETVGGRMPKFNHLVLLAKNLEGYHNLIKMVSISYIDGLYYKPRIDMELLKKHSNGLICLSACLAGAIPQAILKNDLKAADTLVKEFKTLFGEDFYIEIQDHNIKDQKIVLPHLIRLAKENGVKLVATNDVHYINKEDSSMQKVLQCISFRRTLSLAELEPDDNISEGGTDDDSYFPTREFYLKTREEMEEIFPHLSEALDNTIEIADKCDCYYFAKKPLLPLYDTPKEFKTPYDYLHKLTFDGLKERYKNPTEVQIERANYELGIIKNMGFVDYFLIVWDFIHYAETQDIPVGPGRGSGVGSIVAYSLGITKVDPLRYDLIFERFLNPERVSSPDFDIDFCVDRREDVIKYVVEKYGHDNVSQIITYGTLAAKAAVKDVGRVFSHPYSEVEKITKNIPAMMGKLKLKDILGMGKDPQKAIPDLVSMYNDIDNPMAKSILDMAVKIEGMPRQTGMHAAGVIICKDPISDHIPMAKTSDNIVTTEFNMIECEELGLLKMDFLGLRTLTDIKKAQNIVKKTQKINIDFYELGYEDNGVFSLIGDGDTHAVFQLESEGMKKFMKDLKPSSLEDIIAGISLYRPGPMDKIPDYVHGKKNPQSIVYDHPLLEQILDVTYGVMVYQEQVMKIVQVLAGYSLGRADELRRIMSKKKHEAMEKERQVFLHGTMHRGSLICGAIKNGVDEKTANKIFDDMVSFASYAFNKSHAAAYAVLAYQTAYLKKYYPVEFITAVLNNRITSIDEIKNYLSYLKVRNIDVLPPDINRSFEEFTVEDGKVRIGMAAIKNVGAAITEEIVKEREKHGNFTDFEDFISRMDKVTINKRMLESLIYAGAFDGFKNTRKQLIHVYDKVLDRILKDRNARLSGQFSFFDDGAALSSKKIKEEYPDVGEFILSDKLKFEKEVAGVYLTGHPLQEYESKLNEYKINSSMFKISEEPEVIPDDDADSLSSSSQVVLEDGQKISLGGMLVGAEKKFTKMGKEIGIGRLEDLFGTVEFVVGGNVLSRIKDTFIADKLVTVTGKVNFRDGEIGLWVDGIKEWGKETKKTEIKKEKKLYMRMSLADKALLDSVQDVLLAFKGDKEAIVQNMDDNKLYPLLMTDICEPLLLELCGLLGEDNIKILVR